MALNESSIELMETSGVNQSFLDHFLKSEAGMLKYEGVCLKRGKREQQGKKRIAISQHLEK